MTGPPRHSFRQRKRHPKECRRQQRNAVRKPVSKNHHVRRRSRRSSKSARDAPDRSTGSAGNAYQSGEARRTPPSTGYVARTGASCPLSSQPVPCRRHFVPACEFVLFASWVSPRRPAGRRRVVDMVSYVVAKNDVRNKKRMSGEGGRRARPARNTCARRGEDEIVTRPVNREPDHTGRNDRIITRGDRRNAVTGNLAKSATIMVRR